MRKKKKLIQAVHRSPRRRPLEDRRRWPKAEQRRMDGGGAATAGWKLHESVLSPVRSGASFPCADTAHQRRDAARRPDTTRRLRSPTPVPREVPYRAAPPPPTGLRRADRLQSAAHVRTSPAHPLNPTPETFGDPVPFAEARHATSLRPPADRDAL